MAETVGYTEDSSNLKTTTIWLFVFLFRLQPF